MWSLVKTFKISLDQRSNLNGWRRISQGIWGMILGSFGQDKEWVFEQKNEVGKKDQEESLSRKLSILKPIVISQSVNENQED